MRNKLKWIGKIISVQPRIKLLRSFDQRSHSYLGYVLMLNGKFAAEEGEFSIGIGKAAQFKHKIKVGDQISGESLPVPDKEKESVAYYKTSNLKILFEATSGKAYPPWEDIADTLEIYRARGHRRLSPKTYAASCKSCKWGCRMPVTMIIDHWNPGQTQFRFETFCYGPKSCRYYKAGSNRNVPGRKGMMWTEPDWVDEEYTAHRGADD